MQRRTVRSVLELQSWGTRSYISIRDLVLGADPSVDALELFHTEYPQCTYIKGRYLSPWSKETEKSFMSTAKWLMTRQQGKLRWPAGVTRDVDKLLQPRKSLDMAKVADKDAPHITWIGHATVYTQIAGLYFITDPMFSERAFPTQLAGPKRYVPPAAQVEDIPIDVVLLSHTHYDHLDYATALRISNRALWLVPLGVKPLLAGWGITNVVELNWWDSHTVASPTTGEMVNVHFTPAKHWTARSVFDRNTCLWGSFAVVSKKCKFFFSGDTAYCSVFKQIGGKFGGFDLAALGIGAYKPRYFMKDHHCDPADALQIHRDVGSQQSVAIHWGTFPLADEDLAEPPLELTRVLEESALAGKHSGDFFTLLHGETHKVGDAPANDFSARWRTLYEHYKEHFAASAGHERAN